MVGKVPWGDEPWHCQELDSLKDSWSQKTFLHIHVNVHSFSSSLSLSLLLYPSDQLWCMRLLDTHPFHFLPHKGKPLKKYLKGPLCTYSFQPVGLPKSVVLDQETRGNSSSAAA